MFLNNKTIFLEIFVNDLYVRAVLQRQREDGGAVLPVDAALDVKGILTPPCILS